MRTAFLLVVSALALAATAAQADDIRVRPGRRAFESALRHAKPGDRLIVRGTIRGGVVIDVPGVTIDGGSRARFIGPVTVNADGVTIRGVRLKRAELVVNGADATIEESKLLRSSVYVTGDRASFTRNKVDPQRQVYDAVTIRGDDAVVAGNELTTFTQGFRIEGANAEVRENTFDNGWTGVTAVGDDAIVADNTATSLTVGFIVGGDRAALSGNEVHGANFVIGDDAVVRDNVLSGSSGDAAVTVAGDRALIESNTLSSGWGGVDLYGDFAAVASNDVTASGLGSGAAIGTVGDGATISGNVVSVARPLSGGMGIGGSQPEDPAEAVRHELSQSAHDGISVFGNGNVVSENDVQGSVQVGAAVRVQGDGNSVDANTLHDLQRAYAVAMIGDGNTADANDISDVNGEGVVVQGADGVVSNTTVSEASYCGFLLVGGARLENCTATGCWIGVVNLAQGSSIVDTTVAGNAPYDLVDLAGATVTGSGEIGGTETNASQFPDLLGVLESGYIPAPVPVEQFTGPDPSNW